MHRKELYNKGYSGNLSRDTWDNGSFGNIGDIDLSDNYSRQGMYDDTAFEPSDYPDYPTIRFSGEREISNRREYDYQRYDRRCPYCGCPDLLYETINRKTDAGGILTTLIVIVVLAVGGIALLMAMPFLILLIPILIVKKGVGSLRGDSDGALRITCKACGRRIRKFKKL